jgi:small subunit ribosomal protein S3
MGSRVRITLNTSRPGIVIGKKGAEIEKLKKEMKAITKSEVLLVIREIKKPEINAQLVAENIAMQLQRRIAFRRAMKKSVLAAMKAGALGIKVACSGRLAGADMARTEWYIKGRVPLQTLRADIDYGTTEALTTYGITGIKVWVFTGEIVEERNRAAAGVE